METSHAPPTDVISPLAGLGLFSHLSHEELAAIEPLFEWREFEREEVLFAEGEPPEWLYIVVEGHVKLIKHSDDGRDVILHLAIPGDIVGGVSAFGRRPHPFTAQALVPCTVLRVAGRDFGWVMDAHPQVARSTLDVLVDRLVEAHEMMKSMAVERVERRIARQLIKLTCRAGAPVHDGIEIVVPLVRQDVADLAGTTVETAIRVLSRWRRDGLVVTRAGHIVVTDVDRLGALAENGC
jgi:CRP/FNR family transcriptional regulator